jgi:hypothetical protein
MLGNERKIHLEDLGVDVRVVLHSMRISGLRMWSVFVWLRIRSGGVLMWGE